MFIAFKHANLALQLTHGHLPLLHEFVDAEVVTIALVGPPQLGLHLSPQLGLGGQRVEEVQDDCLVVLVYILLLPQV